MTNHVCLYVPSLLRSPDARDGTFGQQQICYITRLPSCFFICLVYFQMFNSPGVKKYVKL